MTRVTERPIVEGEAPMKCDGSQQNKVLECLPAPNALAPANGRAIDAFAKGSLLLDRAVKVEEIRGVENYFQLALEFAKKAKCERLTVNKTAPTGARYASESGDHAEQDAGVRSTRNKGPEKEKVTSCYLYPERFGAEQDRSAAIPP